ncbi:unnamed protein product [Brassica rapa subsp. narinosa]
MLAGRVINLSCVVTKVGFSSAPCHQGQNSSYFLIQIKTIYSRKRGHDLEYILLKP